MVVTVATAKGTEAKMPKITEDEIRRIYYEKIFTTYFNTNTNHTSTTRNFALKSIQQLELAQYLEQKLWPTYCGGGQSSQELVLSIVAMINEKFRERITTVWDCFQSSSPEYFSALFTSVTRLILGENIVTTDDARAGAGAGSGSTTTTTTISMKEKISLLLFLIHCFNSVEIELIRTVIQKYISMPIWCSLSEARLKSELSTSAQLQKYWRKLERQDRKLSPEQLFLIVEYERKFLHKLILDYFDVLACIGGDGSGDHKQQQQDLITYCERFLELLIDLEALLPTRRFFNALIDDLHVVTISRLSPLANSANANNVDDNQHSMNNSKGQRSAPFSGRRKQQQSSNNSNSSSPGHLFTQLLDILRFYTRFEIDDITGEALTDAQIASLHFNKLTTLQKTAYRLFADDDDANEQFRSLFLASVSSMDTREQLLKYLSPIDETKLIKLCDELHLGIDHQQHQKLWERILNKFVIGGDGNGSGNDRQQQQLSKKQLLLEIIVDRYERRESQLKRLNSLPLYPSEAVIWDENLVPSDYYSGDACLALPKLNIQFLTLHDYLLRNFTLFRLESTYEIRQDIEQAVAHLKPWQTEDGTTMFGGWARMAIPIDTFTITEIGKPKIGECRPSRVKAEVVVNLNVKRSIKQEWEHLRRHDVCFLISVQPETKPGTAYRHDQPFIPQVGLLYVRGCEIEGMLDPTGRLLDENQSWEQQQQGGDGGSGSGGGRVHFDTDFRTYRVWLDTNQYALDIANSKVSIAKVAAEEVYDTFNILVRRKSKENNFKAVLETIRDLMNTRCVVPDWLHDVILGYGDPGAAHYSKLPPEIQLPHVAERGLDFFDTFLDLSHIRDSFPQYEVVVCEEENSSVPPYRLRFVKTTATNTDGDVEDGVKIGQIHVHPYSVPNRGPYVENVPKRNTIRFTSTQVEAIRSGIQHGLTMVVGPPGTGKTDVAVQIISTLYHNHPEQRTLIVTHSNQALNAMFEKIMQLDIDERHLLRLGHGEEELETEKDFSRYGRVNYVLAKRLQLLDQVGRLAQSFGVNADSAAYTCETAGYFYLYHVLSRWEAFLHTLNDDKSNDGTDANANADANRASLIAKHFPFLQFFSDAPRQPLFGGVSYEADMKIARGCFRYLKKIFIQLEEFRPFEMLRTGGDRANYLLVREAKIIAMTCTHAALKRSELVQLAFQYDNILMEESAQILEIETFIPLLLQNPEFGHNRLKRWIMIGDHLQLPPVIKNVCFQKFSNMEQSLFTRFVRLGVPIITLDAQGRSRAELAALYSWRYQKLGNLSHVLEREEFQRPNPGFLYNYQLVNVEDFNGVGESEPIPHFYQNLAEAEYTIATYMYMRLIGYPADRITILTTYNGQKHLLRDVARQRCATNPFIGLPAKITTVDKYQGQQNDYILLSLVRTKTVGHIRDIRRLTVAMSRARLGLIIFARQQLFASCYELQHTFRLLTTTTTSATKLKLLPTEQFDDTRESLLLKRRDLDGGGSGGVVHTIDDMPKMIQFVFEFYAQQIERMKQQQPEMFEKIISGGGDNKNEDEEEEEEEEVVVVEKGNTQKIHHNDGDEEDDDGDGEEVTIDEEMPFEPLADDDQAMDDEFELESIEEEENRLKQQKRQQQEEEKKENTVMITKKKKLDTEEEEEEGDKEEVPAEAAEATKQPDNVEVEEKKEDEDEQEEEEAKT